MRAEMKRRLQYKVLSVAVACMTVFSATACGSENVREDVKDYLSADGSGAQGSAETGNGAETTAISVNMEDQFSDRDLSGEYKESEAVKITLEGSGAKCDSKGVTVDGNTVTITAEGVYLVSGKLQEGMLVVAAGDEDKVQIVLDNAEIVNSTNAAIYIKSADKVFLTLAEGSANSLGNGGSYTALDDNNIDGVIFSKSDITVNGSGNLEITAQTGHGIVSKDDLKIAGGNITVQAAGQGLSGKDSVRIAAGTVIIDSDKDGIHSDNEEDAEKGYVYIAGGTVQITSGVDGIDAVNFVQIDGGELLIASGDDGIHSDGTTTVNGGNIQITESYEGIEGNKVVIAGGNIRMVCSDDGINAAGGNDQSGFGGFFGGDMFSESTDFSVEISGGVIYMDADGDGVDSNGSLIVTGGELYIAGPENGANGALDYTSTGQAAGGTVVAVGSMQMAMNFDSTSTQGSILISTGNMNAGTAINVKDADGTVLVSYVAESGFNSVLVTSPLLKQGNTYTVSVGETNTEVTLDELIYGSGMGGFGGGMGGHGGMGGSGNMGGFGGGNRGDRGEKPEGQSGEMPEMPSGETPQMPNGEVPEMPSGEMPQMPGGEMPNGEAPQMPGGEMPSGEAPEMPNGEMPKGQQS